MSSRSAVARALHLLQLGSFLLIRKVFEPASRAFEQSPRPVQKKTPPGMDGVIIDRKNWLGARSGGFLMNPFNDDAFVAALNFARSRGMVIGPDLDDANHAYTPYRGAEYPPSVKTKRAA